MTLHLPEAWVWCIFAGLLAGNLWFLRAVINKAVTAYEQLLVTNQHIAALQHAFEALTARVEKLAELRIDVEVLKSEALRGRFSANGKAHPLDDAEDDPAG